MNSYLDRELTEEEAKNVRRHVKVCHACALKFSDQATLLEETRTKMERIATKDEMIVRMSGILDEVSHSV
jgi:hypothetical protein